MLLVKILLVRQHSTTLQGTPHLLAGTVPAAVGRCRVVPCIGAAIHERLAVTFGYGVAVPLLAHELRPHGTSHAGAAAPAPAGHHVTTRAVARTHGWRSDYLRRKQGYTPRSLY